jgi:mannose-1-phosphate guanylyltransferase
MRRVAVIMAGGAGTRLWPLSRQARPKQLLRLVEGKSLLCLAYDRLRPILAADEILVIAADAHLPAIAAELPELPRENLIGEPCGRDTANAIALAAAIIQRRYPDAVMGVFTADHVITPQDRFAGAVDAGYGVAEAHSDALVTFGIRPTAPLPGLGYVQRGAAMGGSLFAVRHFKEKPDEATARSYLASGDFYWNSGMFVWRAATILEQIRERLPQSHAAVTAVAADWPGASAARRLAEVYPGLPRISIDYAVMEKAPRVLLVEMDVEWHDLGSWIALRAIRPADPQGNVVAARNAVALDSTNNVLVAEDNHLIATIGVSDLVVVHSGDATLVCRTADAERIKEIVARLERRHGERYS